MEDSQFYVADAVVLEKDPSALFYVARIMAGRLFAADSELAILTKQIEAVRSSSALKKMVDKIQKVLSADTAADSR